jgi:hypothetical protein
MTASIAALLLSVVAAAPCRSFDEPGVKLAQRSRPTHAMPAPAPANGVCVAVSRRAIAAHNR